MAQCPACKEQMRVEGTELTKDGYKVNYVCTAIIKKVPCGTRTSQYNPTYANHWFIKEKVD